MSTKVSSGTDAKHALIEKYLSRSLPTDPVTQDIARGQGTGPAPLSFGQEQLWIHSQLAPDLPLYNQPLTITYTGPLDVRSLERSFNEILRRHEAWRTTFAVTDGELVQVVQPLSGIELPVTDLRTLTRAEQESESLRLATADAREIFDLSRGPLLRARLVRLANEEHRLFLTLHQMIFDGISMYSVFLPELAQLYEAFADGKPSPLPELPIQYTDYSRWQRQRLNADLLASQLAYWRQQLENAPETLDLPTDRPQKAEQTFRGAQCTFALPETLSESLRTLSRREGVTLFVTLLAAFQVLLYRWTGQEDVVVGTVTTTRNRPGLERLLGFFLNTLVVRTSFAGHVTFRELLSRTRDAVLGALSHSDLPVHRLVQELQARRDRSRNPLFQVLFVLEPYLSPPRSGWDLRQMDVDTGVAIVDLHFVIEDRPEGLVGRVRYNSDLFDLESIDQLLAQYEKMLETILKSPDQRVSALPLLTSSPRQTAPAHEVVIPDSSCFEPFPRPDIDRSLTDRFALQTQKHGHRIAVHTARQDWTYAELDQESTRIARAIATSGPAERIALLLDHDAWAIAAILGALKAGSAYVPIDPWHPAERLSYILRDSAAGLIVTNNRHRNLAHHISGGRIGILNLDELPEQLPDTDASVRVSADHLAYILYTSGSTGRPKGVMQNHRNVLHFIGAYTNNLHLGIEDKLTLLSSYSVDAAIMDIFGALLNGATLYPIDLREQGFVGLRDQLNRHEITVYHSTPTVYRHFIRSLEPGETLSRVRLVVLGGEEVFKTDVERYREHFGSGCVFVNGFGPTESTVALQHFVNHATTLSRYSVPVGHPVEETQVLLVDRDGQAGQVYGEIAIKSRHVALGYWQKPDLTRAAFRSDPEDGERREYRTGDMGRLLPDGGIVFTGRRDSQVKIRGFRVEIGEVESAMSAHPAVKNVAVVALGNPSHDRFLAAYVQPRQGFDVTAEDLARFVKGFLPDYMVPSTLVMMADGLPLTASGKVDRNALPAPQVPCNSSDSGFVPPQTPVEEQVAAMWSDVLGLFRIGIHDNFFDLGGNSLRAIQLITQIKQVYGKHVPLSVFLQGPTIEQLARVISEETWPEVWSALAPIQPHGSKPPFFWVHGDASTVFLSRYLGIDQPLYGLDHQSQDGSPARYTTVESMASHYLDEVRSVQSVGPYFLGGFSFGGWVAFEMAQQLTRDGADVALLVLLDSDFSREHVADPVGSHSVSAFGAEARRHLRGMATLEPHKLIAYLIPRLKNKLREQRTRVTKPFKTLSCNICLRMGRPIPASLLSHYLLGIYRTAQNAYEPSDYLGRVVYVKSERRSSSHRTNWAGIIPNGLEWHEMPGDHVDLITQPYIPFWAEKLKEWLEAAQRNQSTVIARNRANHPPLAKI